MKNKHKKVNKKWQTNHIVLTMFYVLVAFVLSATVILSSAKAAYASVINQDNIITQINKERMFRGISPLEVNYQLTDAAYKKSMHMIANDYFEHYAMGLSPWVFITNAGYEYLYAGENLAMDFETSEGMVRAWMNSKTHRGNILNPDYDDVGIGIVKGEYSDSTGSRQTVMVTNMFGYEKPKVVKVFDNIVDLVRNLFN